MNTPDLPRWHWRNLRGGSLSLWFSPLDWHLGMQREDDFTGGHMVFGFGPFGVRLEYDIGNNSRERFPFGLSESAAYSRAERFEA